MIRKRQNKHPGHEEDNAEYSFMLEGKCSKISQDMGKIMQNKLPRHEKENKCEDNAEISTAKTWAG